jgi:hypothetical protein
MELSPSREAAGCAATKEITQHLWNPKVHYRVYELPLVPVLSQTQPTSSNLSLQDPSEYYPPIYALVFLAVSFFLVSINNIHAILFSPIRATRPVSSHHSNFTFRRVHVIKLLIKQFPHPPVTLPLFGQNILLSSLFSSTSVQGFLVMPDTKLRTDT